MKTVSVEKTSLSACIKDAQSDRIVITRNGKPILLVVGVKGMDKEQLELGTSDRFWRLIKARRKEKTLSREALEKKFMRRSRRK